MPHNLIIEPGDFSVLRRSPEDPLPPWLPAAAFWTVTRAADELSVICASDAVPYGTAHDGGWCLLRMEGPFSLDATGVLRSVLEPLADANVGIMAISTFNTDYILVKHSRLTAAVDALRAAGHTLRDG